MNKHLTERLPDLLAGFAAACLGAFAYIESSNYQMGQLRAMDAGYFPWMVSVGLMGLGLLQMALATIGKEHGFGGERVAVLSIIIISGSLLTFAYMVERFGIIPAIFCSVLLSTFASEKRNYVQALILSAATAVISAVVFVMLLGLSIKVFVL